MIAKIRLYMEQGRYAEALKEIEQQLSSAPNDYELLIYYVNCLVQVDRKKEALKISESLLGHYPDDEIILSLRARVLLQDERLTEAEEMIRSAIAVNPARSDFYAILSSIYFQRHKFEQSLLWANKGLEADPADTACMNFRSMSLNKLGRVEEARQTMANALEKDPEDAFTHTSLGWNLLENNDHKKALVHFREALRLAPSLQMAKAGMVEAMKARYWLYRIFLQYAFWLGKKGGQVQLIFIIGLYVGMRALRMIARSNPELEPLVLPVIVLYTAFALFTWVVRPLSNLILRLDPYGRYALSKDETISSTLVGVSLLVGVLSFGVFMITALPFTLNLAIWGGIMMIPFASMLRSDSTSARRILIGYTSVLNLLALAGTVLTLSGAPAINEVFTVFIVGTFIYQWVSNFVLAKY